MPDASDLPEIHDQRRPTNPDSYATITACVRSRTPSSAGTAPTWDLTVSAPTAGRLSVPPALLDHMDSAKCLTPIDELCAREFPAEHGRTDVGTGGPGYLTVALETSGDLYEDDGGERERTEACFEADRDAVGTGSGSGGGLLGRSAWTALSSVP